MCFDYGAVSIDFNIFLQNLKIARVRFDGVYVPLQAHAGRRQQGVVTDVCANVDNRDARTKQIAEYFCDPHFPIPFQQKVRGETDVPRVYIHFETIEYAGDRQMFAEIHGGTNIVSLVGPANQPHKVSWRRAGFGARRLRAPLRFQLGDPVF